MPASVVAEGGCEYEIRVEKSSRTSETGHHRIELTELHSPQEQDRTQLQADTEFYAAVLNERFQDRQNKLQATSGYQRAARLWRSLYRRLDGEGGDQRLFMLYRHSEALESQYRSRCPAGPRSRARERPEHRARGSDRHWHTLEAVQSCSHVYGQRAYLQKPAP